MNAREIQLPLRSDPVPLPRALLTFPVDQTRTDPKPDLMFRQHPGGMTALAATYHVWSYVSSPLGYRSTWLAVPQSDSAQSNRAAGTRLAVGPNWNSSRVATIAGRPGRARVGAVAF